MARRGLKTDVADSVPFDNDGNNFTADNVQDAIEEARASALGSLVPFEFVVNGNVSDKWLGYANSVADSSKIPMVVPQNSELKGITFSNLDDDVDIHVEVYKNGVHYFHWEVANKRWAYEVGGLTGSPIFAQGDRVSVFLEKVTSGTGDNTAQDPIVTLYMKFIAESPGSGGAQNGVT